MFRFERVEKKALAIAISVLLAGLAFIAIRRAMPSGEVLVERFDPAELTPGEALPGLGEKIDINEADARALCRLKGVGEVLASRIVEYRTANGAFYSVEDIKKVKGIGQALFEKIKDDIRVE